MDKQLSLDIIKKLRAGELKEYRVKKEQFLPFREILVSQEDFKHYRGIAQQGGDIVYTYTATPRS